MAAARWARLLVLVLMLVVILASIGAPTPPLFAGLLGAMTLALTTNQPLMPHKLWFRAAQAVIGVSVAVQVDPAALSSMGMDAFPITGTILATIIVSVACGQLLRLHGVSAVTATFSSIAGGASGMVAVAHDFGADSRIVMVNQYLRVLFVLLTLPIVVTTVFASTSGDVAGGSLELWTGGPSDYLYVALALGLGLPGGNALRLPAPSLLGPLLTGVGLATLSPFDAAVAPGWIQAAGFLLLGAQVGLRFTRETLVAVARMMPTALLVCVISVAACAGLGIALAMITGESYLDAYLATTPGGLPAVLATSTETAGNVTFVTAAQTIRLMMVLLLAPFAARLLFRRRDG